MDVYRSIVKMWQDFQIKTEAELAMHLDSFRILFAYHSNKNENDNTTYDDTYEAFTNNRVTGYTGDIRTLIEIQNQKHTWRRVLPAFGRREPIDQAFVCGMQRILTEGAYDDMRVAKGEKPGEFHAKFEFIHPFADGNDRTGRTVMNYCLILHDHPPIVIHDEDRREYYEALEAFHTRQDLDGEDMGEDIAAGNEARIDAGITLPIQ